MAEGQQAEAIAMLFTIIQSMIQENAGLTARLGALLKQMYGRRSEKMDPNQLQLFLDALSEDETTQALVDELPVASEEPLPKPEPKPAPHGRKPLPADLPRETIVLEPPLEDRHCAECGIDKKVIGHETSEVLEWVPGHFLVQEIRRVKMSCPKCENGVVVAPVADKVIDKGRPGPGLMTHLLVGKYMDSLPLTRQAAIFSRHGVDLSTSTMSDWVAVGADAFRPIYQELMRLAMEAHVLGTDDTGLLVLDKDHEKGRRKGYMWAYVADNRKVIFDYTPNRKADGPASILEKRSGIVQCDGYTGYKRIARDNKDVVWAGCMAHARRKFVEAVDSGDGTGAVPVKIMQELYKIEAEATDANLTPDQRLEKRQAYSRGLMVSLGKWLRDMKPKIPPKTPLGRAITYMLNQWQTLQVYLTDGRIPIDNNQVERQIRRIAVGRKNYLFAGSDEGARRAAILYSVLGTCSLVEADPFAYMRDVLERISRGWPASRIGELLPEAWVAEQARKAAGPPPATDHDPLPQN